MRRLTYGVWVAALVAATLASAQGFPDFFGGGLNGAGIKRVAFDSAKAPKGKGWSCFDRTKQGEVTKLCYRSSAECDDERAQQKRAGAVVAFCQPAQVAYCYYVDYDPSKSGALLTLGEKRRDIFGCFDSMAACKSFSDDYARGGGAGVQAVSQCKELR